MNQQRCPSAHTGEDGDQERQDESEKFKEKTTCSLY